MKKIMLSLLFGSIGVGVLVTGSIAYFSDTETSKENMFQTGSIDLKIDNESYYNGAISTTTTWQLPADLSDGKGPSESGAYYFFNFNDLKPDDEGEDTISLHLTNNPGYACMNTTITKDEEITLTEPELTDGDDPNSRKGELGDALEMVFWSDDGDNVYEQGEKVIVNGPATLVLNNKWPLADSKTNNVGGVNGQPLDGQSTYYIAKAWCLGSLTLTPVNQDGQGKTGNNGPLKRGTGFVCDGTTLNNLTQSDLLMADVNFYAVQQRHNTSFICPTCEAGAAYAVEVIDHHQGLLKNGSPVPPLRSVLASVLGSPDGKTNPDSGFYSLGFGGYIVVKFANKVVDVPGDDLSFNEITNKPYPVEQAKVEVSQDGVDWHLAGYVDNTPVVTDSVNIGDAGLSWIQYVRFTDTSNPALHLATADGYDLDSFNAVQTNDCIGQDTNN